MKFKHTPGPWHVAGLNEEFVNDPHEMNICRVNPTISWRNGKSVSDGPDSHRDNGRLIAAAPEAIELLTEMRVGMNCICQGSIGRVQKRMGTGLKCYLCAIDAVLKKAGVSAREGQ